MVTRLMSNFIELYVNALSPKQCDIIVNDFDVLSQSGLSHSRQNDSGRPKISQEDSAIDLTEMLLTQVGDSGNMIPQAVNKGIIDYCRKYEVGMFNGYRGGNYPIMSEGMKIQKTEKSQGYHVWHCERSSGRYNNRVLSWILYLNDVEEGGETEFLHYSKRFQPMKGSLLVFPAHFTHVHRGNPPLSGTKYIATGWHQYINH